jgi:hypothetical protein
MHPALNTARESQYVVFLCTYPLAPPFQSIMEPLCWILCEKKNQKGWPQATRLGKMKDV